MLARLDFTDGLSEIKPLPNWVEFQGRLYVMRADGSRTYLEYVDTDKRGVRRYKEVRDAAIVVIREKIR